MIIVDDGSTDGGAETLDCTDDRIHIIRQENGGINSARNHGIRVSRGHYLAFLDSDDEWLPHFLLITHAFLEYHPEAAFVATEFLVDWPGCGMQRDPLSTIVHRSVPLAEKLGSTVMQLPPGCADDYLRVFDSCEINGPWWERLRGLIADAPLAIRRYHGRIGDAYHWGEPLALWCLLLRRSVLRDYGPLEEHLRHCSDYRFRVELSRRHVTHLIALPSVIKHQMTPAEGSRMAGHLATGRGLPQFTKNHAELFSELFLESDPENGTLRKIYGLLCLSAARALLEAGDHQEALRHFALVRQHLGFSWRLWITTLIARLSPTDHIAQGILWRLDRLLGDYR